MAQGRVAVLAATVTAVAVIFVGINGGVAASVLDSVISYFRSVAVITPAETSPESEVLEFASPPEAPDGFCVTEEKTEEETYFIRYKNTVGDFIIVEVRPTNPSGVIHGTDGNTYGEVKIGDFTGYMFYSEGERKGSVIFGDAKTTVTVSGICDSDVLLQLARELVE